MLIIEYRIVLPMTVAEYRIGQLYSVAQASRQHTTEEEGVEIVTNSSFENLDLFHGQFTSGQYTYKIYHLESKIPTFLRVVLSASTMTVHEEAWNAFPYCRTILTNPSLRRIFKITIESIHLDDAGDTENAHSLPPEVLEKRKVVYLDIARDSVASGEFVTNVATDPALYRSEKTGRGPLGPDWRNTAQPIMTCYKLVKVEFALFGVQNRIESWIQQAEQRLFLKFHRQLFCTTDEWYNMTIDDVRKVEEEVQNDLDNKLEKRSASAAKLVLKDSQM